MLIPEPRCYGRHFTSRPWNSLSRERASPLLIQSIGRLVAYCQRESILVVLDAHKYNKGWGDGVYVNTKYDRMFLLRPSLRLEWDAYFSATKCSRAWSGFTAAPEGLVSRQG